MKINNANFILQKTQSQQRRGSADDTLPKAFFHEKGMRGNHWTIWHIGAGVGLLGGLLTLGFASFLTVIQFLYSENSHGSWLYMIVLPLWVLGAHCFDKVEDIDKARRIEYCKNME